MPGGSFFCEKEMALLRALVLALSLLALVPPTEAVAGDNCSLTNRPPRKVTIFLRGSRCTIPCRMPRGSEPAVSTKS